jgi:hypothetical protein
MTTYYSTVPCFDLLLVDNEQILPELANAPSMVMSMWAGYKHPRGRVRYKTEPYAMGPVCYMPVCPLPETEAFYWAVRATPVGVHVDGVGVRLLGGFHVRLFNNTPHEHRMAVGSLTRTYTL